MSKNEKTKKKQGQPVRCWRCGRMLYENIKTGHTGCKNTKCRGYLVGSKYLKDDMLKAVRK